MSKVLTFTPPAPRHGPARAGAGELVTLPVKKKQRPARRGAAVYRAQKELEAQAWQAASYLGWLHTIAQADPDPRAIEQFMAGWEERHIGDLRVTLEWLNRYAEVWARRDAGKSKPQTRE